MCTRMWGRLLASVVGVLALSVTPSLGQSWPQRTVRLIVPIPAGAGIDVAARLFADGLAKRWSQAVVVENRPGADGLIGTAAFAGMRDDHTLLFSPAAPISVLPVLHEKLPYDPARDLVPIARATDTFLAVAASASSKIGSLAELVTRARSQPGKLNYFAAAGAFPTLFAGFANSAGIEMVFVSYRDSGLAVQDLAEGRVHVMLSTVTSLLPQVYAGKVRFLAVTNSSRAPIVPEVPTAIEAGYADLAFDGLAGIFGPRDISTERRDRISADVRAIATDPVIADRLAAVGQIARGSTPAEFAAAIAEQRAKIAAIVKLIGTKPTQ